MNPMPNELPTSPDIPLHDIRPLMDVPDHSLSLLLLLGAIVTLLVVSALYLVWRHLRVRWRQDKRRDSYDALKSVSFDDPKQAAYAITRHGRLFSLDGVRYKEAYENLVTRLARYKYKREVTPIDAETIAFYRIYLEMIDV